jgi:Co/Zn/Cd efflux system component
VVLAFAVTFFAAAIELGASQSSGSLFLSSDAVHLLAHGVIFGVLFVGPGGAREDIATMVVLFVVLVIGAGILWESVEGLLSPGPLPDARLMLVSLAGLAANLTSAFLFRRPSGDRPPFRVALVHELADGTLTLVALAGAGCIALFGWHWVDPGLSLSIGVWLEAWAIRLLVRRFRAGPDAWAHEHP